MATAKKRGDSYSISASCGYAGGKRVRRYMTWTPEPGMTEKQIEKELNRQCVLFEEKTKAGVTQDGRITFHDYAEKYMREYAAISLKARTCSSYAGRLPRINQAIGHIKLKDLRVGHLNTFYANLMEEGIKKSHDIAVSSTLNEKCKARKLTNAQLSEMSGVSTATMSAARRGKPIYFVSAEKIAKALNLDPKRLFKITTPDRSLSPSTVRTYHRCVSSILGRAVEEEYIQYNPATKALLPRLEQKEAPYLQEDEARHLVQLLQQLPQDTERDRANIKYKVMITFDLMSGLRRGELLGLRWCDIDFTGKTLTVRQTSNYIPEKGIYIDTPKNPTSKRPLKLSNTAINMLLVHKKWQENERLELGDAWKDKDGRIFTNDMGAPLHPDTVSKWFREFIRTTDLPYVSVHSLRHTAASLMIAEGTPLVVVSRRLGHAQVSTTANIYSHVIASADEKAAEIGDQYAELLGFDVAQ